MKVMKSIYSSKSSQSPLPSEEEILSTWKNKIEQPLVSIVCITYNHEQYIEDALRGFLTQVTDFSFEIIIHDDASSDLTPEIIKRYHRLYPRIIKPIFQIANQYSILPGAPGGCCIEKSAGRFIAICEGDDFWISPLKLQKQITALSLHPEQEICFHQAIQIDATNNKKKIIGKYRQNSSYVAAGDIIKHTHGQIPTASLVITRDSALRFYEFMKDNPKLPVGDVYLQIISSIKGGALFIAETMSLYRIYTKGSWTARTRNSPIKINHTLGLFDTLLKLDQLSNKQFHTDFMFAINNRATNIITHKSYSSRMKAEFVKKTASHYSPLRLALYMALCHTPRSLLKVIRKLHSFKKPAPKGTPLRKL